MMKADRLHGVSFFYKNSAMCECLQSSAVLRIDLLAVSASTANLGRGVSATRFVKSQSQA